MKTIKERAAQLLKSRSDEESIGDAFALLQELVDAPEPEPVAWKVDGKDGETMCVTDNKFAADRYIACGYVVAPLYTAPPAPSVPDGFVHVYVSGLTGSGKSAVAGEIEIAMRAIGLDVEWVNSESEKRLTHADYAPALELYKPKVRIFEKNIPRAAPTTAEAPADVERDAERLDWLEQEAKESRTGVSIVYKNQADDEGGIKRGYRLMRYHRIFSARLNLREAIDFAIAAEKGQS